jgi:hypothetical protein
MGFRVGFRVVTLLPFSGDSGRSLPWALRIASAPKRRVALARG